MASTRGSARLWTAGGALAATALVGATWLVVVSPQLSQAASLHSQRDAAEVQNAVLQAQLDRLQHQQRQLPQLRRQLAAADALLPPKPALARFTDQVQRQAAAASVSVSAVVAGQPTAATPPGTPAAASAPGAAAAPAAPEAGGGSAATGSGAAGAAPTTTGLFALPVSVVVSGSWRGDVAFLRGLQYGGPRAVLVSSVDLGSATGQSSPGSSGEQTMTVQCTLFVSVSSPAPTAASAAPTAPDATTPAVPTPAAGS
jgi:type IV pilus assembly protein PilO